VSTRMTAVLVLILAICVLLIANAQPVRYR
jgi:hypothetical protein